jgi:ATPase subunit of ABC transporter with duplicated ATPase domains
LSATRSTLPTRSARRHPIATVVAGPGFSEAVTTLEASLLASLLSLLGVEDTPETAGTLVRHKFPLALASRPLRLLSAGERARAALIVLFRRSPPPELLILDEPTRSLDLVGERVVKEALRRWPGGLRVASQEHGFLSEIGFERTTRLGDHNASHDTLR